MTAEARSSVTADESQGAGERRVGHEESGDGSFSSLSRNGSTAPTPVPDADGTPDRPERPADTATLTDPSAPPKNTAPTDALPTDAPPTDDASTDDAASAKDPASLGDPPTDVASTEDPALTEDAASAEVPPTEAASTEDAASTEVPPTEAASAEDAASTEDPPTVASTEDRTTVAASTEDVASTEDAAPTDGVPADGAPTEAASAEDAASTEDPPTVASTEDRTTVAASIEDVASIEDAAPTDGVSADWVSADGAPTDGARADGARADGARADGARADGASSDRAAGEGVPFIGAAFDGASRDGASADGAPTDRPSTQGAPFDAARIEGAPVDGASSADTAVAAPSGAAGDGAGDWAAQRTQLAEVRAVDPWVREAEVATGDDGTDLVAVEVAHQLEAVVGEDSDADPAEFAAAAVLDVLRASGWADAAEAGELRAEAARLRELLAEVIRDHRAREASQAGVENQQLHWLVPLLRAAHGVAFGSLGAKVALRTAVQDVPPEVLASAGLRIDYGVAEDHEEDR